MFILLRSPAVWLLLAPATFIGADPCDGVLARFTVHVATNNLDPLYGLEAHDFSLSVNGTPETVCRVTHARVPLSLGILLDVSGSMKLVDGAKAQMAALAVRRLIDTAQPEDEFFLDYVNAAPVVRGEFTSDLSVLRSRLDKPAFGETALLDAIGPAIDAMRKARYPNRALLIITDAVDNSSHVSRKRLAAAMQTSRSAILVMVPHPWQERPPREIDESMRRDFFRLLESTGAAALAVHTPEEAIRRVDGFALLLRRPFALLFAKPEPTSQPLRINVAVPGLPQRPMVLLPRSRAH